MSRASKLASARGQAHSARHASNVAREKLRRVTDERDQLLADLHEARKDSARIDWLGDLNNEVGQVLLPSECVKQALTLRGAIDLAMRQGNGREA